MSRGRCPLQVYIKLVKQAAAPRVLDCYKKASGVTLVLGQVGGEGTRFVWKHFYVQAFVSVCVVGVTARILSMSTIVLIQLDLLPWAPNNPVHRLAAFYAYLPLSCAGEALLALYIKPAIIDALTFTLSDWLLSSSKSKPRVLV